MIVNPLVIGIGSVASYLAFKGIEKAFIEPLMQSLTTMAFKRFLAPAWDKLDEQVMLPGQLEELAKYGKDWIYQVVIPKEAKQELSSSELDSLAGYLLKEFRMDVHRAKRNG